MTRRHLILPGICVGALALRLIGLQYGLPAVYNPDEVAIMARALGFAKGTLNPHNFLYPTLYFYVLFAWVGVYLAFVWATGRVASLAALQKLYFTDPTGIYTAGRSLGVAAGTATVWLVHRLGARIGDSRTAAAAALFLAVSPLHVRDSHYVKHDVPATLAIVAAYLAMTRLWPGPNSGSSEAGSSNDAGLAGVRSLSLRDAAIAGAVTGIAFSTHYYCIFLAVPLSWVIFQKARAAGSVAVVRHLAVAAGASAVSFFALSPYLLVEPLTALRDIAANRAIVVDRATATGAFGPALRYTDMLWRDSMGIPVVVLALVGVLWMLAVDRRRAILLLAFPVPFLLFIANTAPASRYLNPVLPFVAVFAGWALARLSRLVRARPVLFWAALLAAALPGALASIRSDAFFRQDDTRTLARAYIESHIPPGSGILVQPYSVPLTMSRPALEEALAHHLGSTGAASTKFQLQLSLDPYPNPAYRLVYLGSGGLDVDKLYVSMEQVGRPDGLALLRRLGVAFVVFKRYNEPDPDSLPFLTTLAREGRRIAAFSPYRPGVTDAEQARIDPFLHNTDTRIDDALERPGPPLEIWQLDDPGMQPR
jgi:DNA-binding transcriptional regulator YdaS (Cro superfamily)